MISEQQQLPRVMKVSGSSLADVSCQSPTNIQQNCYNNVIPVKQHGVNPQVAVHITDMCPQQEDEAFDMTDDGFESYESGMDQYDYEDTDLEKDNFDDNFVMATQNTCWSSRYRRLRRASAIM